MADHVFNEDNFEKEVLKSGKPVLVDFFAEWCGPCKMLAPIVDEIANEKRDWKVGKVDIDECPNLSQQYGVQSIPTLILFRDGQVVEKLLGFQAKEKILEKMG